MAKKRTFSCRTNAGNPERGKMGPIRAQDSLACRARFFKLKAQGYIDCGRHLERNKKTEEGRTRGRTGREGDFFPLLPPPLLYFNPSDSPLESFLTRPNSL